MTNVESMDYTHSHPSTFASLSKYRAPFAGIIHPPYTFLKTATIPTYYGISIARWLSSSMWDFLLFCLLHTTSIIIFYSTHSAISMAHAHVLCGNWKKIENVSGGVTGYAMNQDWHVWKNYEWWLCHKYDVNYMIMRSNMTMMECVIVNGPVESCMAIYLRMAMEMPW